MNEPPSSITHGVELLATALRVLTMWCPTWIVADGVIQWSNDEAAVDGLGAESIVRAERTAEGFEVLPLGEGGVRLVRACAVVDAPPPREGDLALEADPRAGAGARTRGSNKETALLLGVAEATVEAHLGAMFRKSGAAGRGALLFLFWTATEP